MTRAPGRRGSILPIVLFALIVMGLVAAATFRVSTDDRLATRSTRARALALYAAEAGLRLTLGDTTLWRRTALTLNAGDSLVVGTGSTPLAGGGSYRAVLHRVDRGALQVFAVAVTGRGPGGRAGQQTLTATVAGAPIFQWGIYAASGISLSGGGTTDGYNSNAGAYSAASADSSGSLAAGGSITLSNNTIVKGNVTAVGAANVSGATVTGTVRSGAPAFPPLATVPCPTGGYTSAAALGALPAGVTYNATTGALALASGANLAIPTTLTTLYLGSIMISGNATITVSGVQHTDIFVDGAVSISGGGIVNTAARATTLGLSSCGTPAVPASWTLSGGTGAYFTVYAPDRDVTLSGGGALYGALAVRSLTSSGGALLHYDHATADEASRTLVPVPGSWAEVP